MGGREQFPLAHQARLAERVPPGFQPVFPQGMEDAENLQKELMVLLSQWMERLFRIVIKLKRQLELINQEKKLC